MTKYVFKPYSENFPRLFAAEKKRLLTSLPCPAEIEHVGSTAVPGLGGKGIIDIAIAVEKENLETVSQKLQHLGYEFKPNFSTPERLYFVIFLPDSEEETRRYHIHLTYPGSKEWKELVEFRDYLRNHPEEAREYAEVKKRAALEANQDGKKYRQIKEHIFQKYKDHPSPHSFEIEFQPLERQHLPLLVKWLNEPHVSKWWGEGKTWTVGSVETKYASYIEKYKVDHGVKKPIHPFIIFHQHKPIGYIQYYNAFDFPREGFEVKEVWHEPSPSLAALDFYIGEPACLGKGIGSMALKLFLETHVYTCFSACLVDPEKSNAGAVKSYEKAGFKMYCERGNSLIMVARQIYLAPYSEQWPIDFEKEKTVLFQAIGPWVQDIQHVGSTAIPGLAAKPVIDIMIGVRSLEEADQHCVPRIQGLGYDYIQKYESELPNRRYFQKTSTDGVRTHQIHLVKIHSDWWERHLLFRDYLRSHPEVAKEYESLKRSLARKHSDTNEYANEKTSFIRKIEARARKKI